jgi:hypothetical protein
MVEKVKHPEMFIDKVADWNQFNPEVSWFIYDFFRFDLNGYEKLIFYCYYINGMTLKEIASCSDCTFQYIGQQVKKIEKKIQQRWKNKENWRINADECSSGDRECSGRNKERVGSRC